MAKLQVTESDRMAARFDRVLGPAVRWVMDNPRKVVVVVVALVLLLVVTNVGD